MAPACAGSTPNGWPNSGIADHAFGLTAMKIGGHSWLRAGRIWYQTLLNLTANSGFKAMVETSVTAAATEFGRGSKEHKAVQAAWGEVGF